MTSRVGSFAEIRPTQTGAAQLVQSRCPCMSRASPKQDSSVPVENVETLIIGGGEAGLVMSEQLSKRGLPHLILERHRIAERWRSERWDGLKFQFPNWSVRLPDFPFPHRDPDGFATTAEILDYIAAYADFV